MRLHVVLGVSKKETLGCIYIYIVFKAGSCNLWSNTTKCYEVKVGNISSTLADMSVF